MATNNKRLRAGINASFINLITSKDNYTTIGSDNNGLNIVNTTNRIQSGKLELDPPQSKTENVSLTQPNDVLKQANINIDINMSQEGISELLLSNRIAGLNVIKNSGLVYKGDNLPINVGDKKMLIVQKNNNNISLETVDIESGGGNNVNKADLSISDNTFTNNNIFDYTNNKRITISGTYTNSNNGNLMVLDSTYKLLPSDINLNNLALLNTSALTNYSTTSINNTLYASLNNTNIFNGNNIFNSLLLSGSGTGKVSLSIPNINNNYTIMLPPNTDLSNNSTWILGTTSTATPYNLAWIDLGNLYLAKNDASSTYLTKNDAISTYLTKNDAISTYLGKDIASSTYLTQTDAITTYLAKEDATSIYLAKEDAISTYLAKEDATLTYLAKEEATSTYLAKEDATSTYLAKEEATSTYLAKEDATSTYLTQTNALLIYLTTEDANNMYDTLNTEKTITGNKIFDYASCKLSLKNTINDNTETNQILLINTNGDIVPCDKTYSLLNSTLASGALTNVANTFTAAQTFTYNNFKLNGTASNFITINAPSTLATSYTWNFPLTNPTSGATNVLYTTSTSGPYNLDWLDLNTIFLTQANAATNYLTQANAATNYLTKTDATSNYLTQINAIANYLTKMDATSIYLTQAAATSNYLTQTAATSTYLTQATATSNYLTQSNATSTYLTQTDATSTYGRLSSANTWSGINTFNLGKLILAGNGGNLTLNASQSVASVSYTLEYPTTAPDGIMNILTTSGSAPYSKFIWTDLSTYLTSATAASTYLTSATAASTYLTSATAASTYLTSAAATSTYLTQSTATSTYLTSATAASTYLTSANAVSTYLTSATAASTYLTSATAASTYLTQANAGTTYMKLSGTNANSATNTWTGVNTFNTSNPIIINNPNTNLTTASSTEKLLAIDTSSGAIKLTSIAQNSLSGGNTTSVASLFDEEFSFESGSIITTSYGVNRKFANSKMQIYGTTEVQNRIVKENKLNYYSMKNEVLLFLIANSADYYNFGSTNTITISSWMRWTSSLTSGWDLDGLGLYDASNNLLFTTRIDNGNLAFRYLANDTTSQDVVLTSFTTTNPIFKISENLNKWIFLSITLNCANNSISVYIRSIDSTLYNGTLNLTKPFTTRSIGAFWMYSQVIDGIHLANFFVSKSALTNVQADMLANVNKENITASHIYSGVINSNTFRTVPVPYEQINLQDTSKTASQRLKGLNGVFNNPNVSNTTILGPADTSVNNFAYGYHSLALATTISSPTYQTSAGHMFTLGGQNAQVKTILMWVNNYNVQSASRSLFMQMRGGYSTSDFSGSNVALYFALNQAAGTNPATTGFFELGIYDTSNQTPNFTNGGNVSFLNLLPFSTDNAAVTSGYNTDKNWHLIGFAYDTVARKIYCYCDGVRVGISRPFTNTSSATAATNNLLKYPYYIMSMSLHNGSNVVVGNTYYFADILTEAQAGVIYNNFVNQPII